MRDGSAAIVTNQLHAARVTVSAPIRHPRWRKPARLAGTFAKVPPASGALAARRSRARRHASGRLAGVDAEAGVLDGVVAEAGHPGRAVRVGTVGDGGHGGG